jgi:hypothetical protein
VNFIPYVCPVHSRLSYLVNRLYKSIATTIFIITMPVHLRPSFHVNNMSDSIDYVYRSSTIPSRDNCIMYTSITLNITIRTYVVCPYTRQICVFRQRTLYTNMFSKLTICNGAVNFITRHVYFFLSLFLVL